MAKIKVKAECLCRNGYWIARAGACVTRGARISIDTATYEHKGWAIHAAEKAAELLGWKLVWDNTDK